MARPRLKDLLDTAKEPEKREYRWWVIDDGKKLELLEYAFRLDCTDEEACAVADIVVDDLYYYQRKVDKQFQVKKAKWKLTPYAIARNSVINGMKRDPDLALKYLERKRKDEFSTKTENSVSFEDILKKADKYVQ